MLQTVRIPQFNDGIGAVPTSRLRRAVVHAGQDDVFRARQGVGGVDRGDAVAADVGSSAVGGVRNSVAACVRGRHNAVPAALPGINVVVNLSATAYFGLVRAVGERRAQAALLRLEGLHGRPYHSLYIPQEVHI